MELFPPEKFMGSKRHLGSGHPITKERDAWVIEQRTAGVLTAEIAKAIEVPTSTVSAIVSRARRDGLMPAYDQSKHSIVVSGMTEEQRRIRSETVMQMVKEGRSGAEVAEKIGVHLVTAQRFMREARAAMKAEAAGQQEPETERQTDPPAAPTPGKRVVVCRDGSRVSLPCFPGEEYEPDNERK